MVAAATRGLKGDRSRPARRGGQYEGPLAGRRRHPNATVEGAAPCDTAGVYPTFERGAQDDAPTIAATDDPDERLRIDVFLVHGQEAAALAVRQSGYRVLARFSENALGQTAFTLESGPDLGPALAPVAD